MFGDILNQNNFPFDIIFFFGFLTATYIHVDCLTSCRICKVTNLNNGIYNLVQFYFQRPKIEHGVPYYTDEVLHLHQLARQKCHFSQRGLKQKLSLNNSADSRFSKQKQDEIRSTSSELSQCNLFNMD